MTQELLCSGPADKERTMKELMSMMVCLFLSALLGLMVATGWVL